MVAPVMRWRVLANARSMLLALLFASAGPGEAALRIQSWTAPSGASVLFVENHDLAMLDVSVELPAGSARDARETSGLANLTLRLMRLGADGLDEDGIARGLADVGANLNVIFDVDRAGYSLRTLSSEAEQKQALSVLSRVLQAPSFPEKALEREKASVIAGLKEADTKPDVITARAFACLVFRDHPYALRTTGEPGAVVAITRDALVAFYRSHYTPARAV